MSVLSKENKKETMNELNLETARDRKELSVDELDQVSGAGNPFEDIPRVPNQPIDDDLSKKV